MDQERQSNRERKRSYEIKDEPEEVEISPAKRNQTLIFHQISFFRPEACHKTRFYKRYQGVEYPRKEERRVT